MRHWQKLKNHPELWEKYFIREKIIRATRDFFYRRNFREVETPLVVPAVIPESYLDIFQTFLVDRKGKKHRMFLTPSPEVSLKKLLAAGLGDCFEITRSFRNRETGSYLHNPEFSILEWYRSGADYRQIMKDCENLVARLCWEVKKGVLKSQTLEIIYQKRKINLTPPWERISVPEAMEKYAGIPFDEITDKKAKTEEKMFPVEKIAKLAVQKDYSVGRKDTWEQIFNQIFLNEAEPRFYAGGKPVIVYDYPRPVAALAKVKESDPRLVERFEFYIGGLEIGDAYTELTDYQEQKRRFKNEVRKINGSDRTKIKADEDFLEAIRSGLPDCAGIAIGLDRLVMLLADAKTIEEVRFFPVSEMF